MNALKMSLQEILHCAGQLQQEECYCEQDTIERVIVPILRLIGVEVDKISPIVLVRGNRAWGRSKKFDLNVYRDGELKIAIECKELGRSPMPATASRQEMWRPRFTFKGRNRSYVFYYDQSELYRAPNVGRENWTFERFDPTKMKIFAEYNKRKGDVQFVRRFLSGFHNVNQDGITQLWRDCNSISEFKMGSTIPIWTNGLVWLVFPDKGFADVIPTFKTKSLIDFDKPNGSSRRSSVLRVDFSGDKADEGLLSLKSRLNPA